MRIYHNMNFVALIVDNFAHVNVFQPHGTQNKGTPFVTVPGAVQIDPI
jgi:hypothetical protein